MHALKLRGTLSAPYQIGPHQLRVPASIGVSIYPDDGTDGDVLIGYADAAMYHAKSNGGPGRACFTRDMLAPAARQPFAD
jgi:predicted signal transduction protein with EAL and GGDEF domain